MSDINNIVEVNISRNTVSVAQAAFGTPAIIGEFPTTKTTPAFDRYRYYASVAEMLTEGFTVYDREYQAANKIFSQDPTVEQVMVGRKDANDTWVEALTAIQIATQDWYAWGRIATKIAKVTLSADFVADNAIVFTINGTAAASVTRTSNQTTTMGLIKAAIEGALAGSSVTVGADPFRTMTVELAPGKTPTSISMVVTGGASQPTMTFAFDTEDVDSDSEDCAEWNETQKKIMFLSDDNSDAKTSAVTDIGAVLKALGYDRTVVVYTPNGQQTSSPDWVEFGWMGECLPFDPGSQTWAFKTIVGVAAYGLTSSERGYLLGKNVNIYTATAGVSHTEDGKVVSGEYIDIIRGIDWLESSIQEGIFTQLMTNRKIPYTDEGITMVAGVLEGKLKLAATQGVLIRSSIIITVPKLADIPVGDKTSRTLPDLDFTANLQGAIHKVEINGTVSV